MGQKVHPTGARLGIIKDWSSKWYANDNNFADYLVEDQKIRKFLKKKEYEAGIANIEIERTISFRRAMKQCMQKTMKSGAAGIKTAVSGRLGGADMARTEFYKEGNIPLQTLRADIDYGFAEANTTYGKIGVKVWIYKGEVLPTKKVEGGDK